MNASDAAVKYVPVCSADEVQPGERILFEINGNPIVLFNVGGQYYAIQDACTHDGSSLGDGDLEGHEIICPRHGARFDIRTGQALTLPAVTPAVTYPLRVVNGRIEIGILSKTV